MYPKWSLPQMIKTTIGLEYALLLKLHKYGFRKWKQERNAVKRKKNMHLSPHLSIFSFFKICRILNLNSLKMDINTQKHSSGWNK